MIDLKLDTRGDIILDETPDNSRIKVSFGISPYPILKITFRQQKEYDTDAEIYQPNSSNKIKIKFKTIAMPTGNQVGISCYDKEEIKQRIRILLKTNLGEISSKEDFGTLLNNYRHKDLTQQSIRTTIEEQVEADLANILENPSVMARHERINSIFYYQNLTLYIYNNDQPVCDLTLEDI